VSNWCICPECGERYNGSDRYGGHCMECHRSFSSDYAGDRHRVGPHHPRGMRRCLTIGEMLATGWRESQYGWTDKPPLTDEEKARLRATRPPVEAINPSLGTPGPPDPKQPL